jgi:septal ring factor EnvC (AmiA/AmiB activator)
LKGVINSPFSTSFYPAAALDK